jgi:hypothetical protein
MTSLGQIFESLFVNSGSHHFVGAVTFSWKAFYQNDMYLKSKDYKVEM